MSTKSTAASPLLPVAAALFTVAIWANFLVTTGGAVHAGLGPIELGVLRSLTCAIGLAPILWRIGVIPKGVEFWRLGVMVVGAGISFMFLLPAGFAFAPPADSGVFAPGVLPLWVAILSMIFLGEKISAGRIGGFLLIAIGVLSVGGYDAIIHAADGAWRGYALFSTASFCFACYAIAQRGSGLSALEATAIVSFWSAPVAIIVAIIGGADFSGVSAGLIVWTAVAQFFSGVVAVASYTFAVIRLGPSRGTAFVALTPAVVALASDVFLGQPAAPLVWFGVAIVSVGVVIASGVLWRRNPAVT